VVSQP
jgi:hypothetical protein